MGKIEKKERAHVLVFPYPAQGHINPMLQFAKRLAFKGLQVSLVTTIFLSKSMHADTGEIKVELTSDGCDEGGHEEAGTWKDYVERFKTVGSASLFDLIAKFDGSDFPVKCIIYDSMHHWVLPVARRANVFGAVFSTQSCTVEALYYNAWNGWMTEPATEETIVCLPGLPEFKMCDLPSFVSMPESYPDVREYVLKQFSSMDKVDWVLCNSFEDLESKALSWMKGVFPVKMIGPSLPSMYLDKCVKGDIDHGISLWKKEKVVCREWLDARESDSVIYVSFGSVGSWGLSQMEEMARALEESGEYFLWVVRETDESKLPQHFAEENKGKGLIVRWSPQLEVLSHRSVGCFITHCGWNSTLEGLCLGVPMVAVPQWTDQPTNAKYVEVLGVGVRARADDLKGFVRREEIKRCIWEVMEGERREEIKRNIKKWKETAKEALMEGGSSDKNIQEFVAALLNS